MHRRHRQSEAAEELFGGDAAVDPSRIPPASASKSSAWSVAARWTGRRHPTARRSTTPIRPAYRATGPARTLSVPSVPGRRATTRRTWSHRLFRDGGPAFCGCGQRSFRPSRTHSCRVGGSSGNGRAVLSAATPSAAPSSTAGNRTEIAAVHSALREPRSAAPPAICFSLAQDFPPRMTL